MKHKFLGCRYPIIAAPMNRVSDLNLAIACHNAGVLPSLTIFNWIFDNSVNWKLGEYDIKQFQDQTGSNNILLSMSLDQIEDAYTLEFLVKNKIDKIEIVGSDSLPQTTSPTSMKFFEHYRNEGILCIAKQLLSKKINTPVINSVMLKGPDGAGRGLDSIRLEDEIIHSLKINPALPVIASGGIGTSNEIRKYLELGCSAVAIGTLLAVSEESCIPLQTKLKMIQSSSANIERLKSSSNQNALIFKELLSDDVNNTQGLIQGISTANIGHVLLGSGIDHIDSIRPVNDIIGQLVEDIPDYDSNNTV